MSDVQRCPACAAEIQNETVQQFSHNGQASYLGTQKACPNGHDLSLCGVCQEAPVELVTVHSRLPGAAARAERRCTDPNCRSNDPKRRRSVDTP